MIMKTDFVTKFVRGVKDLLLSIVQVDPLLHHTKLDLHRMDSNIFR